MLVWHSHLSTVREWERERKWVRDRKERGRARKKRYFVDFKRVADRFLMEIAPNVYLIKAHVMLEGVNFVQNIPFLWLFKFIYRQRRRRAMYFFLFSFRFAFQITVRFLYRYWISCHFTGIIACAPASQTICVGPTFVVIHFWSDFTYSVCVCVC